MTTDLLGNAVAEPLKEAEPEVVIVDDVPGEDRGGSDDDEFVGDGRVKKRINRLRYEFHEERRAKEAAHRLQEEAVGYAQQVQQENSRLRDLVQRGEHVLLSEVKARSDSEASRAQAFLKQAHEDGDAEKIAQAQAILARIESRRAQVSQYSPQQMSPEQAQQAQMQQAQMQQAQMQQAQMQQAQMQQAQTEQAQQAQQAQADPKAVDWASDNEWFGKDQEMTSFAYGLHEKLVREEGVDPRSEDYYERIDSRMREVFPNNFSGGQSPGSSTVVAPARRSSGGRRNKVSLTSTQVSLAKRLGITPEQYAQQLLKEQS